jgi:adenine-specific DNA-methyltransferase
MPTLPWIGKDKVINHHYDVPFKVLDHQYTFNGIGATVASTSRNADNAHEHIQQLQII